MSVSCPSAIASLDDSLAVAYESLRRLEAAESVDVAEMIRQLETAAESSRKLRTLVSSELPGASWTNREELDEIIERNPEKFNGTSAEKVNAGGNK
jgi:benzoyl-CoA reductase/2-hydroxyglutaryl-CoA dehydratase subunit BcrC/BadD/HgdB